MSKIEKILVTGGAGFIGSHTVVELVNAGYEAIIADNFSNSDRRVLDGIKSITGKEIKVYEVDCAEKGAFDLIFEKEKNISGVIHFAAYKAVGESVKNPLMYYKNNILSTIFLLEAMKKYKVKNLVFSSSCTVYGQPKELPVMEDSSSVRFPESPYGNTKQVSEEIINDTVMAEKTIKAVLLRYFNPIGAHESALIGEYPLGVPNNLVPYITQTASGIRTELTVYGSDYDTPDGSCIRDYIHVVDLANAHVKSIDYLNKDNSPYIDVFNIGTGKGNSVMEVITTFEKVTGVKLNYKIGVRRSGDIAKIFGNVDKAAKVLNWKAEYSLADALSSAWKWQQNIK